MTALPGEVTQLLLSWNKGDKQALDHLIPLVETELRRLARRFMRSEREDHTLETSALINEAYVRLVDQSNVNWQDRSHFFAVAAQVMRHILIDHARKYQYAKRGGGAEKVPLEEITNLFEQRAAELIAMDDALRDLATADPRKCQVVELRFFGGLSIEETAEVLGISPATVIREWRTARAWLHRAISGTQP
ncbi:MAG TPA: sigma-70 family RNA polymerase sigma factor [Blastocatellia bacterium]|nr:sigma-70 family RNA polymerase sigma factor [Blastocatellia bacterium]